MNSKTKEEIENFLKEIEVTLINSRLSIKKAKEEMEIIDKKAQENILKLQRLL